MNEEGEVGEIVGCSRRKGRGNGKRQSQFGGRTRTKRREQVEEEKNDRKEKRDEGNEPPVMNSFVLFAQSWMIPRDSVTTRRERSWL